MRVGCVFEFSRRRGKSEIDRFYVVEGTKKWAVCWISIWLYSLVNTIEKNSLFNLIRCIHSKWIPIFCVHIHCAANLSTFAFSTSIGWIGIALMKYESDESPLPTGRVHAEELGWIASLLGIGGLIGTVTSGWMANCFGRKFSLLAMAIPQIVSY